MGSPAANTGVLLACLALSWQAHAGPAAADAAAPSATGITTLRCGTLIDGASASPRRDVAIRIEDGRIVAVGPFSSVNAGTVIDRSQDTCLPGLIDAHAHVLIKTDDYQVDHLRRSSAYKALRGLNVVQEMLRSGWTTVRILGDADVAYAHFDVRTAIQEGLFIGPRLTGAGHYFSITGGGGDLNFIAPEHRVAGDGLVVDGVDAVRKAVREEIKHGSDWIKVLASGAMMSAGNDPNKRALQPRRTGCDRRRSLAPRRAGRGTRAFRGWNQGIDPRGRAHDRARHVHGRREHQAHEGAGRLPGADALRR